MPEASHTFRLRYYFLPKINIFNAEYQNVFTLPRHPTGTSSNCLYEIVRFEIVGGFIVKPKNNITLVKKRKTYMNECTPTQYGVKQPSVETANTH